LFASPMRGGGRVLRCRRKGCTYSRKEAPKEGVG